MGCDISVLSKHNLNISNLETLANDLSERLNLNIDYGYYSRTEYNNLLENNFDDGLKIIGSIKKNDDDARYLLVDEKYQEKQVFQKIGEKLFEMKEYWDWLVEIPNDEMKLQEKKEFFKTNYFLDSIEGTKAEGYLNIYDEIIGNDLFYYTRWWDFCRTIQNTNNTDYLYAVYFQTFRKSIMKSTIALGGDKAYFVNDQCEHLKGVGQGDEMFYTWEALEQYIHSREKLEIISISKAYIDREYQLEVSKKDMRNLAFFDDFFDILE